MSGIAGVVCLNKDDFISEEAVLPMFEAMRPDITATVETYLTPDKNAAIGKISYAPDISYAKRKPVSENGLRIFLVGEIYNDDVLNYNTAEDFLINRYLQYGEERFAQGLNGSFAAAITNPIDNSITLVTDHTVSCPIFTTVQGSKFFFASEVKGLIALREIACEPDVSSVISLATREFFVRQRTLVEDIRRMDYATICRIQGGKVGYRSYWRYIMEPAKVQTAKYYLNNFAELLCQAVHRRTRSGKCAIMLSGGMDSRGILSCLKEPSGIPLVTYTEKTIETRPKLGDWAIAEKIARHLDMDLTIILNDPRDFARAMQESVYASDGAAGFVFENIWGGIRQETGVEYLIMGDECMGWSAGFMSNARLMPSLGIHSLRRLTSLQPYFRKEKLNSFMKMSESDIQSILSGSNAPSVYDRVDELYFHHRLTNFLNPKRRIISRHGLLVRNPWLDLDVLNFIRKVPVRHRIEKNLFRKTVTKLNPAICSFPRARLSETGDHQNYLGTVEREHQVVSKLIFENNPLLEDLFDGSAIRQLLVQIPSTVNMIRSQSFFNVRKVLPRPIAVRLAAMVRYFANPAPQLNNINLALRIATVATALRHLANRMSKPNAGAGP